VSPKQKATSELSEATATETVDAKADTMSENSQLRKPATGTEKKVTVNLSARSVRALGEAMDVTDDGQTETINRALQVYAFLQRIWNNGGSVLVRETPTGEIERLRVF
jgi:hypothetical protein